MRTLVDVSELLREPLERKHVKTRKGAGNFTLSYVEGWHVIAEANHVFGFDGWSRTLKEMVPTVDAIQPNPKSGVDQFVVGYRSTVIVTVHFIIDAETGEVGSITREGTGYGTGIAAKANDAHEIAIKESETDAMKRGFMTYGMRFGLALYDKDQVNVSDKPSHLSKADSRPVFSKLEALCHAQQSVESLGIWWKSKETQTDLKTMHPDFVAHVERVKDEAKERLI